VIKKENMKNSHLSWFRGLSGDFFHAFHNISLYCVSERPGFSSLRTGSSASSKACQTDIRSQDRVGGESLSSKSDSGYRKDTNRINQLVC